jgi:hypothetical protein
MYVFVHVVHKRCTGLHTRPEAVHVCRIDLTWDMCLSIFKSATGSEHMVNWSNTYLKGQSNKIEMSCGWCDGMEYN